MTATHARTNRENDMETNAAKYQRVIDKATARIRQLQGAGIFERAREMAQGVEITIARPGFGGAVSKSYEIIPWN